jgi:hypothetical protein
MAEYDLRIGYPNIYNPSSINNFGNNGMNSTSQIRRSADMVYQRGGSYEVIVGSNVYIPSMELVINMFANDEHLLITRSLVRSQPPEPFKIKGL